MDLTTSDSNRGKPKKATLRPAVQIDEGNARFFGHDGTTYRMLFGILPNGIWGFIIVKEGADAIDVFN